MSSAATVPPEARPEHPAFDLVRTEILEEYGAPCTIYRHRKTGAELLSVANDDENKVFGITFRTPPADSTGVPHILEHSVLCGSRKYMVKEPFVHLLRSSLQTFLNAFTYPDRTCYPVASQNLKDFYNLVNVYLDAVLHPRAMKDPLVLEQEGWHYEIESPEDPLTYKGVVYNEMKGVYSSPDSRMGRTSQQALFPDTTYGVDSGGSPEVIPSLTFDGFKSFHEMNYHPSNSRIFFYGDDPVDARLSLVDEYLADFTAPPAPVSTTRVRTQRKWSEPRRVKEPYPASADQISAEGGAPHMVSLNWLVNEAPLSSTEMLAMAVIDHLLMGTQTADLYKALTQSGLGTSVIGGGLADELKQVTFSAGLKGVSPDNVASVEALVESTLAKAATHGFDASAVEASLNTIEFGLREFNTGSFPRGLSLMLGAMSHWIYDRDPLNALRFEGPLAELKQQLAAPGQRVLESLVEKYLIENTHKLTVELVPDAELEQREEASERAALAKVKDGLTESGIQDVISRTARLKSAQGAADPAEELAKLPTLTLADLDRKAKEYPCEVSAAHGATVITTPVASNGIVYLDLALDARGLMLDDVPLLGLFSNMLFEVGTSKDDETSFSRKQGARTGGMGASVMNSLKLGEGGAIADPDDVVYTFLVRGKATAGRTSDLLELINDALTDAALDSPTRAVEMLKQMLAGMESRLQSSGNAFAATRISARYSLAGYLSEISGGVSAYATLKETLKAAQTDWPAVLARLQRIRDTLLNRETATMGISADAATLEVARPAVDEFLGGLPSHGGVGGAEEKLGSVAAAARDHRRLPATDEGFIVPTQVNYVAKGGPLYKKGERVSGAATVVARSLRTGYLWDTVRVIGGAYGGSCQLSPYSGTFLYSSYRDPNLQGTLDAYDAVADHLEGLSLDAAAVEQDIIGAVGDLDTPLSPDGKGFSNLRRHLVGEDAGMRQRFREEILEARPDDFAQMAKRLRAAAAEMRLSVFGSKTAFDDAAKAGVAIQTRELI